MYQNAQGAPGAQAGGGEAGKEEKKGDEPVEGEVVDNK